MKLLGIQFGSACKWININVIKLHKSGQVKEFQSEMFVVVSLFLKDDYLLVMGVEVTFNKLLNIKSC